MQRRIIKQKTAYTITLPIKWVRNYNINEKREINIKEEGNKLILSTSNKAKPEKVDLKLENSEEHYCRIMIENHYLKGFDVINISFLNKDALSLIQTIVTNLIGVEIVKQNKTSCIISQTAMPTIKEFKSLFNRVKSIIIYTLQITEESIKGNVYDGLDEIEQLTKDARRFLLFLTRTIHKHTIIEKNDESFMHLLLERMILIQHNQLYMYQKLAKLQTKFINNKIEESFKKSKELFLTFVKQFHKQDMKEFSKISKDWKELYFNHKLFVGCTEEESIILYHSMHLAKLVFLIAQPNQIKQYKYILE